MVSSIFTAGLNKQTDKKKRVKREEGIYNNTGSHGNPTGEREMKKNNKLKGAG